MQTSNLAADSVVADKDHNPRVFSSGLLDFKLLHQLLTDHE